MLWNFFFAFLLIIKPSKFEKMSENVVSFYAAANIGNFILLMQQTEIASALLITVQHILFSFVFNAGTFCLLVSTFRLPWQLLEQKPPNVGK